MEINRYDAATVEMFLLEDNPLEGRGGDLKSLLKWLHLAMSGQTKSVLISGDPGIGKTALLDVFARVVRQGQLSRILDLRHVKFESIEKFYVDILDQLFQEASFVVEEILEELNVHCPEPLITWTRQELESIVLSVKLQEFNPEKAFADLQHELIQTVHQKMAVLPQKPKHLSLQDLEKWADGICDPWIFAAVSILSLEHPLVQPAMELYSYLRHEMFVEETPLIKTLGQLFLEHPEKMAQDSWPQREKLYKELKKLTEEDFLPDGDLSGDLVLTDNIEGLPIPEKPQRTVAQFVRPLHQVFQLINKTLRGKESALLVLVDNWDEVNAIPDERVKDRLKEFFYQTFRETSDLKNHRMMLCVACRNENQSYTLGGGLNYLFQNRLLLGALPHTSQEKLLNIPLKENHVTLDPVVSQTIENLVQGNPFWVHKISQYIDNWALTTQVNYITASIYEEFGIQKVIDLLTFNFYRMQLALCRQPEALENLLQVLVRQFSYRPFTVADVIDAVEKQSPEVSHETVYEALRVLFQCQFITDACDSWGAGEDPAYQFHGRLTVEFLRDKIQPQSFLPPVDDRITALKRTIPLALKSGDLDRRQTEELLTLKHEGNSEDLVLFLERVFLEHLQDPNPAIRMTAIQNMAALPLETACHHLLVCLQDPYPGMRQLSVTLLTQVYEENRSTFSASPIQNLLPTLQGLIEDPHDSVRSAVYHLVFLLPPQSIAPVWFQKGIQDPVASIRLEVFQSILSLKITTQFYKETCLVALSDSCSEIRKVGCFSLRRYLEETSEPLLMNALLEALRSDPAAEIRGICGDILARTQELEILKDLTSILQTDQDEDVRIAIVRALGQWTRWPTEPVECLLLETIQHDQADAVVWACARSLGNFSVHQDTLAALQTFRKTVSHEIVAMTLDLSLQKMTRRLSYGVQHPEEPMAQEAFSQHSLSS